MFLTLLRKECVQYLKSAVYYIFLIYLIGDFFIQLGGDITTIEAPQPEWESYEQYGTVPEEDEMVIMQITLENLLQEYEQNNYVTYPVGFYKEVTLSDEEQREVLDVILDMSGLTEEELRTVYQEFQNSIDKLMEQLSETEEPVVEESMLTMPQLNVSVRDGYSYETFLKNMKKIDELLGGGSDYTENNILTNAEKSPTYEQAYKVYNDFIEKDKITNAYARLFCDYEGITLAIITVFLAVARTLRDRRAQMEQVVYSHRISSAKLILSRYLAAVIMAVTPVLILSCSMLVQVIYYANHIQVQYDLFAFVKYTVFWLLPTILVSLSVGFFLTELTDCPVAIFVQAVWWFASLMAPGKLVGVAGWNLIPRFNSVLGYEIYEQMRSQLLRNRLFYTVLAMVLLLLTIGIYDLKRKGVFASVGAKLRNRKNELEA